MKFWLAVEVHDAPDDLAGEEILMYVQDVADAGVEVCDGSWALTFTDVERRDGEAS